MFRNASTRNLYDMESVLELYIRFTSARPQPNIDLFTLSDLVVLRCVASAGLTDRDSFLNLLERALCAPIPEFDGPFTMRLGRQPLPRCQPPPPHGTPNLTLGSLAGLFFSGACDIAARQQSPQLADKW